MGWKLHSIKQEEPEHLGQGLGNYIPCCWHPSVRPCGRGAGQSPGARPRWSRKAQFEVAWQVCSILRWSVHLVKSTRKAPRTTNGKPPKAHCYAHLISDVIIQVRVKPTRNRLHKASEASSLLAGRSDIHLQRATAMT